MSTAPWPDQLMTMAEWDALDADPARRYELVDVRLAVEILSPAPAAPIG